MATPINLKVPEEDDAVLWSGTHITMLANGKLAVFG